MYVLSVFSPLIISRNSSTILLSPPPCPEKSSDKAATSITSFVLPGSKYSITILLSFSSGCISTITSPLVPINFAYLEVSAVKPHMVKLIVVPSVIFRLTTWWSTTLLLQWNTHFPYGPVFSASISFSSVGPDGTSTSNGHPLLPWR